MPLIHLVRRIGGSSQFDARASELQPWVKELSSTIGNTEFLSLIGGPSVVIEAPSAAGIEALESMGPTGLLLIPFGSAAHAGALETCKYLPD